MSRIANDLITWRFVYRLNQVDAAQLLGVSARQVGRWERGEQRPSEDNYNNIRAVISQPPPWWDRTRDGIVP